MATKLKVKRAAALPGSSPHVGLGELQLGQSGLKRSYGYVYEELLPQLQGRRAVNVYQEMSQNSSVIGAVLFAIDMFMRKVAWRIEAASDSDADQKKAEYVASCKDDMGHSWPDFISEINTMLVFGWSWFEIVYKQRFNDETDEFGTATSKFNDGMIGWKKFMPISQDSWWRWDFDPESGETIGMWQRPAPDYSERYLPIGKSLHFRTTSRKDNPEGASILRTAYRSWYFLKRIEEIEAVGVERDLAGIPIATVPAEMLGENASTDDKAMVQSIIQLVQNVRRDEQEGIVWPQAYDQAGNELYTFKLLTSGGSRQFPTDTIISRYESRIAMTALADFLLLGNDSTNNGSYALATSKSSMFQSALETWLNSIENVINDRAIPLLFRQNGINSGPYPKFRHDIVQKPTLPDLATLVSSMAGAGAQLFPDIELENHLREYAELPIREPNPKNEALEEKIINQQLDTMLASSAAEQDMAERTARDSNAEGVVPTAQGSIVERMDPVTMAQTAAQGAAGAVKQALGGQSAKGTAPATQKAAQATGTGGKAPNAKKGAPTKSTGPVKSKQIPNNRRNTVGSTKNTASTRAAQNSGPKATGGLKNRSVAKSQNVREQVRRQLSPDFPEKSMRWLDQVEWTGPVRVPVSDLNFSNEKSWAAHHEPGKVGKFKQDIQQGKEKPIVTFDHGAAGPGKLEIADGHHHALASRELGQNPLVYIAKTPTKNGPWQEMHSFQRVSTDPDSGGYEPGDKGGVKKQRTITAQAGGVCVKAADTGRVLMLQRGLDPNDPASGKWEFPGGRRESIKESPESAGMREWQEETGMKLPRGKFTGHWISKNGVYHGLVLTVPHEAAVPITGDRSQFTNPDDPDGDNVESLAWWEPKHLHGHPAIRPELADNMKRVKKAVKGEEPLEVQKNAKLAKAEVHYRPATSSHKCGSCEMFRSPDGCTLVKGVIDSDDVCDKWSGKSAFQKSVEDLRKSTDIVMVGGKFQGTNADQMLHNQRIALENSSKPTKKCDYCQRKASKLFVMKGSDGVMARSCAIHAPQARAEMRWTANDQVSPVNASPYEPFPRVITQ